MRGSESRYFDQGLERAANISVLISRSNVVEVSLSERGNTLCGISLKDTISCRENTESNMATY